MKLKSIISVMIGLSFLNIGNIITVFGQTTIEEKVLTISEINKIVTNTNNEYGLPNKYWNEQTGEFIIPDGYTKIGRGAFPSDNYLPNITEKVKTEKCLIKDKVRKVKISNTVIDIEEGAFCGTQITEINLPENLKSIDKETFAETNIKEIKWPSSVTRIEDGMFGYGNLEKIDIPNTVTYIGDGAFLSTRLKEINIPDSVTEIKNGAFYDCGSLEQVKLPNRLTKIPETCFHRANFKTINIPDAVTEIEADAFEGCPLTELKLPANLEKIGDRAFWYCTDLERLEMPGVKSLGNYVFSNCDKLTTIIASKQLFTSSDISKKAFDASVDDWYDQPGAAIKDKTIDVYLTDGTEGLDIQKIMNENKWLKSIKSLSDESKSVMAATTKKVPDTGAGMVNTMMLSTLLSLGLISMSYISTRREIQQ